MATAAAVAVIVSAVAGVASTVMQHRQQKKIAAEQKRQNMLANKQAARERAQSIRRAVAQQRVVTAEAQQAGFQFGVSGSTSALSAASSPIADVAGNIGASGQQFSIQSLIGQSQDRISGIQSQFNPFAVTQSVAGLFTDAQTNRAIQQQFV